MGKLILVRHGKSLWNVQNIFTGWTDIDLATEGIAEAKKAGELLKSNDICIDVCFSSYLKRAIRTAWITLDTANQMHVDTKYHWKLNERHYGAWQGHNKNQILKDVGEETYWGVRRGYYLSPPKLDPKDKQQPKFDANYKNIDPALLPLSESLENTSKRVVNYYFEAIVPQLVKGKTVLVSAHGNSLRALIGYIKNLPPEDIAHLEVPTGEPNLYEFDDNLNLTEHYKLK